MKVISLQGEMKMNKLTERQETIKKTLELHFQENLDLFAEECTAEEFESYLQDYGAENYITKSDWNDSSKKEAYLKQLKEGKKTVKPKAEKVLIDKGNKSKLGKVNDLFDRASKLVNFNQLAEQYGLVLQPGSQGWQNCCCPLPNHEDKSPSFGINFESQTFNCFGCHEKGGALKFLSLMEETDIAEVAKQLIEKEEKKEKNVEVNFLELTPEEIQKKIEEIVFNPDNQMEVLKLECDRLANNVSIKVGLLMKQGSFKVEKYQKKLAELCIVQSKYIVLCQQIGNGIWDKKALYSVHKNLQGFDQYFTTNK